MEKLTVFSYQRSAFWGVQAWFISLGCWLRGGEIPQAPYERGLCHLLWVNIISQSFKECTRESYQLIGHPPSASTNSRSIGL